MIGQPFGRTVCFGLLVTGMLAGSATYAASPDKEQLERGKAAAAACVACHQADGNGLADADHSPWPRLAGLDATYLEKQLKAFQSGDRENAEMESFANMLNDDQIADVSAYYASLPARAPTDKPEVSEDVLERGKQLAISGDWNRYIVPCMSCHGPDSQGVGSEFPDIAGQHPEYIQTQLQAWKDGTRQGDPLDLMKAVSDRLEQSDMEAVSAWLGTQTPANAASSASD